MLLAAIPHLDRLGLPHPTATDAITATGASRTTAYKLSGALTGLLPTLERGPGRPRNPVPEPVPDTDELHQRVVRFLFDNPGCVTGSALRRVYTPEYVVFVLDLYAEHADFPLTHLARAVVVPLPTLEDWIRGERPQVTARPSSPPAAGPSVAHVEAVLDAERAWKGGFRAFCDHVQFHLRIPLGRQHISDILAAHGVRIPKRRRRPPDASALRGGFESFFPGAQWIGDGTELVVTINGQRFACNLELNVDVDSGAFVGASVRPTEDSAAVVEAFADGVATAGAAPLALLLDNKPSNHTDEVVAALGTTTVKLWARPYTPTDKPHAEGGFGLFSTTAPALVLHAANPAELAGQIARLVATTWGRAVNHRPRADRGGKTRAALYRAAAPTPEEVAHARKRFAERLAVQQRARDTRERNHDPVARAALDDAFARLGLDDPDGRLRAAIACWPLDAVLAGIATFEGKRQRGTLPDGAGGPYLRGIVVNLATEAESMAIADALLAERIRAKDRALAPLDAEHERLDGHEEADPAWLVRAYVRRAMDTRRTLDRLYWLRATVDVVLDQALEDHRPLLRLAARHISATHTLRPRDRHTAIRFLFAKAVPVA